MLFPPAYTVLVPCVALDLTWLASTRSASRPAIELPRVRTRSAKDLRRSRQLERMILLLFLRSGPTGKKEFLASSTAHSTAEAFNIVRCSDHSGKLDDSPQDKKNKRLPQPCSATNFIGRTVLGKMSLCASRILGPFCGFRISQILRRMKLVSRASRPGLTVGFLRIFCNGLCAARRFHVDGEEQMCRLGCPDEPDPLPHYNECPLLYNPLASTWEHATALPRRGHLLP